MSGASGDQFSSSARVRVTGFYGISVEVDHSGLMLAARITLPHFSVSSTINLSKVAGESVVTIVPNSVKRAFTAGSARTALISLLSLSMIGAGVFLGAPTPDQEVTS